MRLSRHLMILALLFIGSVQAAQGTVYSFGVVPQQSASMLARLWVPLLQQLSADSGLELRFATATDIPTFEERLGDKAYDFAYMNPYHYTVFHRVSGYEALNRESGKKVRGLLVVRVDSPINSLEQLRGQTLAFPSPAAFAASILPRAHLRQLGIAFTPQYVASHDSVYAAVARGVFPAGGGILRTLGNIPAERREQLRVLWKTPGYTPHAVAALPRVPLEVRQRVQRAFTQLWESPLGRQRLQALNMKAFQAAEDADWDDVRSLGIDVLAPSPGQ